MIAVIEVLYGKLKDNMNVLSKYVSSIVYLAYDQDIITEDFYNKYALSNTKFVPNKKSFYYSEQKEEKFFNDCEEFSNWIRNALYEDEETKEEIIVSSDSMSNTNTTQKNKKNEKTEKTVNSTKQEEQKNDSKKEEINIEDI